MKEAIYTKLKQAYSPLGLGDAVLMGQAEALAALGYVTQDNIDAVVAAQKPFLEQLQKSNDARAQSAAQKARENAEKLAAEAAEKALADAQQARDKAVAEAVAQAIAQEQAKAAELAKQQAEAKAKEKKAASAEVPAWYTEEKRLRDEAFRQLQEQAAKAQEEYRKTVEQWQAQAKESLAQQTRANEALQAMQAENEKMKAEKRAQERQAFISAQALGMGIPQYRVDEGFAGLTAESTDDEIAATLATVARNIKANMLPEQSGRFPMADAKPSDDEIKEFAKALVR